MTILRHEIKRGRNMLLIWTAAVAFLMGICVLIYPEMSRQMGEISESFANMGGFSAAFGMDRINFGEFTGFFGVECGNILGLGGALFAAFIGISALAGEEGQHTAEFLLTHPVSRGSVVLQKLLAVFAQILILNVAAAAVTVLTVLAIGEEPDAKLLGLMFLAYFIMQAETAAVCFGISAFLKGGGPGMGLGLAAIFYFLNLVANLTEKARFLKYLTPFGYTDGADIITSGRLEPGYLAVGLAAAVLGTSVGFWKYGRKDIT